MPLGPWGSIMYDESDDIDIASPQAREATEALTEVIARRPPKPPAHPKYAFRAAIQSSRELKGATKLVGLLLADFVDVSEGYAYPTVSQIMDKLGMPETTVHRALRNLQDQPANDGTIIPGWFRREATKSGSGADTRNHWHPNYAKAAISSDAGGGCQNDRVGCHERHPRVPSTAPLIHTGYSLDSDIKDESPSSKTVGVENESATRSVLKNERERRASDRSTGFDREWIAFRDAYPGRTNGDQWKHKFIAVRMSGVSADVLMRGISNYREFLARPSTTEVPMYVGKWLSGGHWEDERPE